MIKKYTLLLLLQLITLVSLASTDSLLCITKNTKANKKDVMCAYRDLAWEYLVIDLDSSMAFSRKGIKLARRLGYKYSEGACFTSLATAYYGRNQYDSAIFYHQQSLNIAIEIDNDDLKSRCYGNMANVYNMQGNDQTAIRYYLLALELFEKHHWTQNAIIVYQNVGVLHEAIGNYNRASEYIDKAESIARETRLGDNDFWGLITECRSKIMMGLGNYTEALKYAHKALDIYTANKLTYHFNALYQLLARIYLHGFNNIEKAMEFANKSMNLSIDNKSPLDLSVSNSILAEIQFKQGNYKQCENFALQAIKSDTSDVYEYMQVISILAKAQTMLGKKEQAIQNFSLYGRTLKNKATSQYQSALTDMEIRYETQKKEFTINSLQKQKRLYMWGTFLTTFILLLIITILIIRYRLLRQKSQLIATRALLEGETTERARLSRDLHDGLGGLLSVAKHNIANIKGNMTISDDQVKLFNSAIQMLDNSIMELRRVAHNLMPESLMRYGLNSAIKDFCNNIDKVSYHFYGNDQRFDSKLEVASFRIVSELVNNALKHARAEHINVQLVQEHDRINITIHDDGCGFDLNTIHLNKEAKGINSIKTRVSTFNGRIDIITQPNKGTEISIEFKI